MKINYFNNTNRVVNVHPATFIHGCTGERSPIKPLEERTFILPEGTYPCVKMWDDGDIGLSILISPMVDVDEEKALNSTQDDKVAGAKGLWGNIIELISQKVSKPTFDTWFKDTQGEMMDGKLVVVCNNFFQWDWLEEQ